MTIHSFIQSHVLLPRLQQHGVLIVYDPDQRYRDLCLEIASENRIVVDAGVSSIEARESAMATLQQMGQVDTLLRTRASVGWLPELLPVWPSVRGAGNGPLWFPRTRLWRPWGLTWPVALGEGLRPRRNRRPKASLVRVAPSVGRVARSETGHIMIISCGLPKCS